MDRQVVLNIDPKRVCGTVEPMLFGFNFEITRQTWYNGISAQIINNRKFFRYDDAPSVPGWELLGGAVKTESGIGLPAGGSVSQKIESVIPLHRRSVDYRISIRTGSDIHLRIRVGDTGRDHILRASGEHDTVLEGSLIPESSSPEVSFILQNIGNDRITVRSVSLIPSEGTTCGLRDDVIAALRSLKPACLRFPGGCYAEYYDWKEGLLPIDERKPICIRDSEFLKDIVLGPTHGQDPNDTNIDDFVAVCRRIGAEPQFTVRLSENTPEDAAQLVAYANTGAETEYGRKRISRGFAEPYHIRRWYLGNELWWFGRGGLLEAKTAAEQSVAFARAMKAVDPSIELVLCTNVGSDWYRELTEAIDTLGGAELFSLVSYHQYLLDGFYPGTHPKDEVREPETEEGIKRIEDILKAPEVYILPKLRAVRAELDQPGSSLQRVPISFDEWNYCWGRTGHPALALFTAGLLQQLVRHGQELQIGQALYFHPINEGLLHVGGEGVIWEDGGLVWKLISGHQNGQTVQTDGLPADSAVDAAVTLHQDSMYITLINRDVRSNVSVSLPGVMKGRSVSVSAYSSERIWENAYRTNSLHSASISVDVEGETVLLPPSSVTGIRIE